MVGHGSPTGVLGRISYYRGRFDMLVGFLSLALATLLAGLYARKKSSQDLMDRATTVLTAGSATMLLSRKWRKPAN